MCALFYRVFAVEALHIGNLLCQYGYFFPVSDTKNLVVKDDSSLYRFQVSTPVATLSLSPFSSALFVRMSTD